MVTFFILVDWRMIFLFVCFGFGGKGSDFGCNRNIVSSRFFVF